MSFEREQILENVPRAAKAPRPVDALIVTYAGSDTRVGRVDEDAFVVSDGNGIVLLTVEFETAALSLDGLAMALGVLDDVTATVADPTAAAVLAATLLEEPDRVLTSDGTIFLRWQNTNWRLADPLRKLIRAALPRLDAAMTQLNLLTAATSFADYWGQFTATLRKAGESDEVYTLRQLRELTRPRENNKALAVVIETDTGVPVVEVVDLERDVFVCGRKMRGHPLRGWRYNTCTAEVRLDGFPSEQVRHVAAQHIAAGITLFVTGSFTLDFTPSTFGTDSTDLLIGAVPDMQIGVGAIGGGKIHP